MSNSRIDPRWQVNEIGRDSLYVGSTMYAIVDPILWPEWKYWLYTCVQEPEFAALYQSTLYEHIDNGPVVFNLMGSKRLFSECIKQMETSPCGCLIRLRAGECWASSLEVLRQAIIVRNERTEVLLRYHDPRTLLPLMSVMPLQQRAAHFPVLTQCIWHHHVWLKAEVPELNADNVNNTWSLNDKQVGQMQSILEQWSRSL